MKWNDFDVEKIKDDFYVVRQSQSANIGVCVKDNSALLIDSGYSPKKSAALKEILQDKLGCKIELLFNTHYHADHTFGNQSFECPILSSEACKNIMQENLSTHWSSEEIKTAMDEDPELKEEWANLKITFPTKTFRDKLLYDFKGLEVIFQNLGGHTRGSSIACLPEQKLMFSGDILFVDCYPTQLSIDEHPVKLVEALQKITEMDMEIIIPGHGATCDKSMAKRLIEYWECLITECQKHISSGLNDEKVKETLMNSCRLEKVTFNERKHRRNIDTVLKFVREDLKIP
jgi:glyoxylase-like metal-dependent hydrolase (beta-lactamase superfamily II)